VVNHFGALSATDSILRSRVTGFTQGLENTEEPRRPLLGSSLNKRAAIVRPAAIGPSREEEARRVLSSFSVYPHIMRSTVVEHLERL
jgi:hypothetical protein